MSDYSTSPQDLLLANQQKGYVGIHIEQGVPVLDRDLNLLHDLITATLRSVITSYVGNGIAAGADGFAILALPSGQNSQNFQIADAGGKPGKILVGGIEVAIAATTTYATQPGVPPLTTPSAAQPDPRSDTVYLDAFFTEVDSTVDPDLGNSLDVGMETSVRLKPSWVVRVAEGVPVPAAPAGHVYYSLAQLQRPRGKDTIDPTMVTDLRQSRLTVADMEQRLALMERLLIIPTFNASPNQFNPKLAPPATSVTLFGNNFNVGAVKVLFGTTPAALTATPTSAQITVAVPNIAPQAVAITVQTAGGTVTTVDTFQVVPPAPTFNPSPNQFNPKLGLPNTSVTLFGNGFNVGSAKVFFGATVATLVGTPTATQIVAAVPTMATGPVTITVQTGGGQVTSSDTFTVT
jgi:hypothetical protein